MEKFYNHIEKLLSRNDYVVVPGLGGFVLQHQSATIVNNAIHSPCSVLSFNSLMQFSDGLLIIEIARTEQISYRKAQELLQIEIDKIKQYLLINRTYDFGSIGQFSLANDGGLCFSPNVSASFLPLNIGNENYILHEVKKSKVFEYKQSQPTVQIRKVMRYAAIFALIFSMLFLSEKLNHNQNNQSASIVNLSLIKSPLKTVDSVLTTCSELKETKLSKSITLNNDSDLYHVIVASMPNLESAEAYKKMLFDENFESAHVLKPVKTVRVAIKSFVDKQEAIAYMEELRLKDKRFETAWVLCK